MKLITENAKLEATLVGYIESYENSAFAVAWATASNRVFKSFLKHKKRIRTAVVGTHFYQTDPDVLMAFVGSRKVRFMLQPNGVFHPKIFAFWNDASWHLLIGSANLTKGAMETNSEAMLHVSGTNDGASSIFTEFQEQLAEYANKAKIITQEDANRYDNLAKLNKKWLSKLKGVYGTNKPSKPPINSEIMSKSWDQYYLDIQKDRYHAFDNRLEILSRINGFFRKAKCFSEMALGERKAIAGLPTDDYEDWGWFGSMRGAGYFYQAVNNNHSDLSSALDHIPLRGPVGREQYEAFIKSFKKTVRDERETVATASRLLAMKRPDNFVCLDSRNRKQLCRDLGIKIGKMTYELYWEELIERIRDSAWWNSPRPIESLEQQAWLGRVAMLDAIFYNP